MSARVFGGVVRSAEGWTHDLNFEACSTAIDPRVSSTGGANRSRINGAGDRIVSTSSARVDHDPASLASKGLLQEPDAVAAIRNSAMAGAVAGTPGTLPTHWVTDFAAGQLRQVVGAGTEKGMPYVDLRFYSAANDRGYAAFYPEQFNVIPASPGDVWIYSQHVKLVAGSITGINQILYARAHTASSVITLDTVSYITPAASGVSLLDARQSLSITAPALTERITSAYAFTMTVGPAYDFTLRVGTPQLDKRAFATSPVWSSGTALAATPATHFISGAAFAQYFANQGTYLIEFTPYALSANEVYWGIGQVSVFNNSMYLVNSGGSLFLIVYSGGVNTAALDLGTLVAGTRCKVAISYQAGEIAARCNGGTERVSSGAMPAVIDTEGLLTTPWNGGSSYPAAHMHRRRYRPYPSRGDLYQLTA